MQQRLIAIGDIHGEYYKLENLLSKIKPNSSDTIVFTGDYIDFGNYSKDVLLRLEELSKETNCVFLKGNHEDYLLKIKSENSSEMSNWLFGFGGDKTLMCYKDFREIFTLHGNFFKNLKLFYSTDNYFFVHGGINTFKPFELQTEEDLLWTRHRFYEKEYGTDKKLVVGHTPCKVPYKDNFSIVIDTGCGKYEQAKLTAVIINDESFIQSD